MKQLFLIPGLLVGLLLAHGASAANQPTGKKPSSDDTLILKDVDALVLLMSDGVAEEAGDPDIAYIPAGAPSAGAAVVLFYIESWDGGNASSAFLAVFERTDTEGWSPDWKPHPYHLAALTAARGSLPLEIDGRKLSVGKDGLITIEGVTWGPDDPHCCPKKPVTVRFRYEGFELTEVK